MRVPHVIIPKMISKTKIKERTRKKTDSELVETINLAREKGQMEIASLLALPTRKRIKKNLYEINKEAKGETVVIPGKVLGKGEIDKKIKIVAFSFSSSALEKLKKSKVSTATIKEELEGNKKIQGELLR